MIMSTVFEKIKPQLSKSIEAGYESAELVVSQIDRASKQFVEHAKQHTEFTKANYNATLEFNEFHKIIDFLSQQAEATTQYFADIGSEVHGLSEIFKQELKEISDKQFDENHSILNEWLMGTLTKSPLNSEVTTSFAKQSLELANKTILDIRKNIDQSSHLMAENFEQFKKTYSKSKPTARSSRAKK